MRRREQVPSSVQSLSPEALRQVMDDSLLVADGVITPPEEPVNMPTSVTVRRLDVEEAQPAMTHLCDYNFGDDSFGKA